MAPVRNLDEADQALRRLAEISIQVKRIDADTDEAINAIKEEASDRIKPLNEECIRLEKGLTAFAEMSRADLFEKRKSIELTFGIFGFRKSTKISVTKNTLGLLKKLGLLEAVKIKESVNKDVLADYPDQTLAKVKAKRKSEDAFWYEPKEEALSEKV